MRVKILDQHLRIHEGRAHEWDKVGTIANSSDIIGDAFLKSYTGYSDIIY